MEDINNLLNSGEVPNIYEADDIKKILEDVRVFNEALGRPNEPDVIYATFIERIRNYLHIILCMSPVGDALRVRY